MSTSVITTMHNTETSLSVWENQSLQRHCRIIVTSELIQVFCITNQNNNFLDAWNLPCISLSLSGSQVFLAFYFKELLYYLLNLLQFRQRLNRLQGYCKEKPVVRHKLIFLSQLHQASFSLLVYPKFIPLSKQANAVSK